MRTFLKYLAAIAAFGIALVSAGTALADPTGPPPVDSIVAVSTQDLQYLCDQFSVDYNLGNPANRFYCWDAVAPGVGPGTIETKNDPNCQIARPYDSDADIKQVQQKIKTSNGTALCVDMAFTDRNITARDGAGLLSVVFGRDLLTWAANSGGNAVANLTDTDLHAIYECNASLIKSTYPDKPVTWNEVGGASTAAVVPVLPQTASSIRERLLTAIGVTAPGACVVNGTYNGSIISEDEGTNAVFTKTGDPTNYKNVIAPFSGGSYVCQFYAKLCPDAVGSLTLRHIDGKAPLTTTHKINTLFPALYQTGLFVVTLNVGTATAPVVPAYLVPFLGQGNKLGWICGKTAQADVVRFGFATITNCGALTGS